MKIFFIETCIILPIHFVKMCWNSDTLAQLANSTFNKISYYYLNIFTVRGIEKYTVVIVHVRKYMYTYSFFILCTQFYVAIMQTKFCRSYPHYIKCCNRPALVWHKFPLSLWRCDHPNDTQQDTVLGLAAAHVRNRRWDRFANPRFLQGGCNTFNYFVYSYMIFSCFILSGCIILMSIFLYPYRPNSSGA
jgi:hypothetical protein